MIAQCAVLDAPHAFAVDYFPDQSGNGNDLAGAATSGSYVTVGEDTGGSPIQLNGRDVAAFDTAHLQWPSGMMTGVTDATMVVVLKSMNIDPGGIAQQTGSWVMGTAAQEEQYNGEDNVGHTNPAIDGTTGPGHIWEGFGSTVRKDIGAPGGLDDWHVYTVTSRTGYYRVTLDGEEIYQSATNTVGWPAILQMGNRGGQENSRLLVAEIAIGEWTNAQLNDVIRSVADRWALDVTVGPGGGGPSVDDLLFVDSFESEA